MAAPFTPFNSDGSLNLGVIDDQLAYLIKTGVNNAYVRAVVVPDAERVTSVLCRCAVQPESLSSSPRKNACR